MSKGIKNYTSSVPVERTILYIEQELSKIGVESIQKQYDGGKPVALSFSILIPFLATFRLPVNIVEARSALCKISQYRNKGKDWIQAQAERTAWRIMLNWIEVQVAMVQLGQAEALEVFMPYAQIKSRDEKSRTVFQIVKERGNFLSLEAPK